MEIPLECHVPILRCPPLHVVQAGRQLIGVDVLRIFQNNLRFDLDAVRPIGAAFLLPYRCVVLGERTGSRGGGGKFPLMGHVIKYAIAVPDALDLAPVLGFQAKKVEPTVLGDPEVLGVANNHPEVKRHNPPESPAGFKVWLG